MKIVETKLYFTSNYGHRLQIYNWKNVDMMDSAKGVVHLCHGMHSSAVFYIKLARSLVKQGFICYANDHYGHGDSEGKRADPPKFSYYVDDLCDLMVKEKGEHQDLPFFLYGTSLGGLISIHAVEKLKSDFFNGVIYECPAFGVALPFISKFPLGFIRFMANLITNLMPSLTSWPFGTPYKLLTSDESIVHYLKSHPNFFKGYSRITHLNNIISAQKHITFWSQKHTQPTLILFGDSDKLCDLSTARQVFSGLKAEDKTFIEYGNARHWLLFEKYNIRGRVTNDAISWMLHHVNEIRKKSIKEEERFFETECS